MENQKDQNQQNQQGDSNKVEKQFEQNLKKLMGLLKGDQSAFKNKVPNSEMEGIMTELLKDRREATVKQFKEKAMAVLDAYVEFNKFVKQKEKELKDAIVNKKKDFSKQMTECFGLVENLDSLVKDYSGAATELSKEEETPEEEPKD